MCNRQLHGGDRALRWMPGPATRLQPPAASKAFLARAPRRRAAPINDIPAETFRLFGVCLLVAATVFPIGGEAAAAGLSPQNTDITWSARAASQSEAARAQEALLLTLYNTGRLPLRTERLGRGELPGDVLRRSGVWVGNVSAGVNALLCDLNPTVCRRARTEAGSRTRRKETTHVAGHRIGGAVRWTASAGDTLTIPNVKIIQIFRQEDGRDFPDGAGALIGAGQVSRVPACLDRSGDVCVTDYAIAPAAEDRTRTALKNGLRSVTKVLPRFSTEASDAFALVPHLTARLRVSETPYAYYARLPRADAHGFDDPGYRRLLGGIGDNIQGRFSGAIKSLPSGEPQFHRQRAFFEQFFNIARHGEPAPHLNGRPITIVVVDHKPDITHCDFDSARIELLREPGTFEAATVLPDPGVAQTTATAVEDCDVRESPWLREFHGTHILGLAAARRNNKGGAGLLSHFDNVDFKVIPIDIDRLRGDENYVAELSVSLREAVFDYGANIINLSWAYTPVDGGGQRDEIRDLIDQTRNFVVWFAAAGNEGNDANQGVCNTRPACFSHPNVAGIVAVERTEDGAGYRLLGGGTETNIGWRSFDMAAPGRDIWSTVGRHEMAAASGTSQSTIIATSAVALVMSKETMTPRAAIERLVYTSTLVPSLKHGMKGGIVDVSAALKLDSDQLWLTDGCAYIGRALSLKFDNGEDLVSGDFVIDSEDPVTLEALGPVHFNLSETRRLYFDPETDGYIAFFVRAGTEVLRRVNGYFGTCAEKRFLRFQIEASRGEDCQRPPRKVEVSVDRIRDFIRRVRS